MFSSLFIQLRCCWKLISDSPAHQEEKSTSKHQHFDVESGFRGSDGCLHHDPHRDRLANNHHLGGGRMGMQNISILTSIRDLLVFDDFDLHLYWPLLCSRLSHGIPSCQVENKKNARIRLWSHHFSLLFSGILFLNKVFIEKYTCQDIYSKYSFHYVLSNIFFFTYLTEIFKNIHSKISRIFIDVFSIHSSTMLMQLYMTRFRWSYSRSYFSFQNSWIFESNTSPGKQLHFKKHCRVLGRAFFHTSKVFMKSFID